MPGTKNDFILLALCQNSVSGVAEESLGFQAIKPGWIYHADLCNTFCLGTLSTYL